MLADLTAHMGLGNSHCPWLEMWGEGLSLASVTLLAAVFPLLIKICLYCFLKRWSCQKYFKFVTLGLFIVILTGWKPVEKATLKQSFPGCRRARCWITACQLLQQPCPAWGGLLKQPALAGSKCPPNVPPGTTAQCLLICLEEHFPVNSYLPQNILHMFVNEVEYKFGLTSPARILYRQNLAAEKDRSCFWPNVFPPPSGKLLHWETFESQSLFFFYTELAPCKKSSTALRDEE